MVLYLDEDQSFSMEGYFTSPGYQSVALQGYLVDRRRDGTYVAPLLPQLFYGANGQQLGPSWRQYIPFAGSQTILSRGGEDSPPFPKNELWWRKVSEPSTPATPTPTPAPSLSIVDWWNTLPQTYQIAIPVVAIASVGVLIYFSGVLKPKRRR